jgi:hypothetical protein
MLLTPVLIFAAFLMTMSFVVAPVERLIKSNLDTGGVGLNSLVAWYLLTFFPALLFAIAYRRISGIGRLRSFAIGHAFVLYGLLWIVAGSVAVWRVLAGRGGWLKTERLKEWPYSRPAPAIRERTGDAAASSDWELDWQPASKGETNG